MPGKIVVTAGPTREKIDAIRFISNRSSGKMGYAIAEAARDAGYDCVLISGPVNLPPPAGIRLVAVESVAQMQEAVQREIQDANALIMAAAPADYRPADVIEGKMKKKDGDLSLRLERTPDILLGIGQNKPVTIYKLVVRDSIEEKILALQGRKRELFNQVIEASQDESARLSIEELRELLEQ